MVFAQDSTFATVLVIMLAQTAKIASLNSLVLIVMFHFVIQSLPATTMVTVLVLPALAAVTLQVLTATFARLTFTVQLAVNNVLQQLLAVVTVFALALVLAHVTQIQPMVSGLVPAVTLVQQASMVLVANLV